MWRGKELDNYVSRAPEHSSESRDRIKKLMLEGSSEALRGVGDESQGLASLEVLQRSWPGRGGECVRLPQENESLEPSRCENSAELLTRLAWETALAKGYEDPRVLADFSGEAIDLWKPTVVKFAKVLTQSKKRQQHLTVSSLRVLCDCQRHASDRTTLCGGALATKRPIHVNSLRDNRSTCSSAQKCIYHQVLRTTLCVGPFILEDVLTIDDKKDYIINSKKAPNMHM